MRKNLLIAISLLTLSPFLQAQTKKFEFEDGKSMVFRLLEEKPAIPVDYAIMGALDGIMQLNREFKYNLELTPRIQGFYQVTPSFQIDGSLSYLLSLNSIISGEDQDNCLRYNLGSFYTLKRWEKLKEIEILIASEIASPSTKKNYYITPRFLRSVAFESYLGFNSFGSHLTDVYYRAGDFPKDRFTSSETGGELSSAQLTAMRVNTIDLGIALRFNYRSFFTIDKSFKTQLQDNRFILKLMIPVYQSSKALVVYPGSFERFAENDPTFAKDAYSNLGYSFSYQSLSTIGIYNPNFINGYRGGIQWFPLVQDSAPYVYIGYFIGFANNISEDRIKRFEKRY